MMDIYEYKDSPLFKSVIELNDALIKEDAEPITLNIVGGFALMVNDIRNKNELTDIDYIGHDLPDKVEKISDAIGLKNHLGKGWINNDIMLAGMSMEDFELATGKLHFLEAFDLEKIKINVLETKDILKLKVIAIDTALSAIDNGGDFTRMKDFNDILALTDKLDIKLDDLGKMFKDHIINLNTVDAIKVYAEMGVKGVKDMVDRIQYEFQKTKFESKDYVRSPFIDNVIKQAMARAAQER